MVQFHQVCLAPNGYISIVYCAIISGGKYKWTHYSAMGFLHICCQMDRAWVIKKKTKKKTQQQNNRTYDSGMNRMPYSDNPFL